MEVFVFWDLEIVVKLQCCKRSRVCGFILRYEGQARFG